MQSARKSNLQPGHTFQPRGAADKGRDAERVQDEIVQEDGDLGVLEVPVRRHVHVVRNELVAEHLVGSG